MGRKNYTTKVLIGLLVGSLILAVVLPTYGQNLTKNETRIVAGGENGKTELSGGTWILTDKQTEKFNSANVTKWSGIEQNLKANCVWVDILNIEHSISCGFKWLDPPRTMQPGNVNKFAIEYIYDDYASTANIRFGIKAKLDNISADYMIAGPNAVDIVKLTKDSKNYISETKTVYFLAPETFLGETNQVQLMVDCYIGQDHYVSYYTYTWSGEESAAK